MEEFIQALDGSNRLRPVTYRRVMVIVSEETAIDESGPCGVGIYAVIIFFYVVI